VKIATWNVNGLRAREGQLVEWLARDKPDVVCLQEIKCTQDQVPKLLIEGENYWGYWHGMKGYSGVALLLRKETFTAAPVFSHPSFDHEARIVTAALEAGAERFEVASIYVPNGGKDFPAKLRFLEALDQHAAEARAAGRTIVLCGDLNVARTPMDVHPKERKPVIGQLPEERALIERILGHGLVDLGRAMAPDDDGLFTWWAPWRNLRQKNVGWRLDFVLPSEELAKRATACVVERDVGTSDHAPVVATFGPS
jgi:exodeoxyribonuclease-3